MQATVKTTSIRPALFAFAEGGFSVSVQSFFVFPGASGGAVSFAAPQETSLPKSARGDEPESLTVAVAAVLERSAVFEFSTEKLSGIERSLCPMPKRRSRKG